MHIFYNFFLDTIVSFQNNVTREIDIMKYEMNENHNNKCKYILTLFVFIIVLALVSNMSDRIRRNTTTAPIITN